MVAEVVIVGYAWSYDVVNEMAGRVMINELNGRRWKRDKEKGRGLLEEKE